MLDWRSLTTRSNDELACEDIAAIHLSCGKDLPGGDQIDIAACLQKLDEWSEIVGKWTALAFDQFFRSRPEEFENSEVKFRIISLVSVLQRHCGLKYDEVARAKTPQDPYTFEEEFIHGALFGKGGTCATLPIIYAAVGRRLGYPIKIVPTRMHLFSRWEGGAEGETLNFEGSGQGVSFHDNDYYRSWPHPIKPEAEVAFGHLKTLTPRGELGLFIAHRGFRWLDSREYGKAVSNFILAQSLDQTEKFKLNVLQSLEEWQNVTARRLPPGFPRLMFNCDKRYRRWQTIPWELEEKIRRLEGFERVLDDPWNDYAMWTPLRNRQMPKQPVPRTMIIDESKELICTVPL